MKKYTTMKIDNQSNPNRIFFDRIGFDFKTKPIGLTNNKTEKIGSDDFSSQNRTNPIHEHPYYEDIRSYIYDSLLKCVATR